MNPIRLLSLAVASSLFALPAFASITPTEGFVNTPVTAAPGGTFLGGMDLRSPNSAVLFDGTSIVEIDTATGALLHTWYTPAGFVFGSFVAVAPSGDFMVFGESTNNTLRKIPFDGSPSSVIATVVFAYDIAFTSDRVAYVSSSPSFVTNDVYRLDLDTGAVDLVAQTNGASGPLAVDASGDLLCSTAAGTFPPPAGAQKILRFTASQLAWASGPGVLSEIDGSIFTAGFTGIADMVLDEEGDLIASVDFDGLSGNRFLVEFFPNGTIRRTLGEAPPFEYAGALAFRGNGAAPAAFESFQPTEGGTLAVLSTDFFSYNDLDILRPQRATTELTPPSPLPMGPFTFEIENGPSQGVAVTLIAAALGPQFVIYNSAAPMLFDIAPAAVVSVVLLPLSPNGDFKTQAINHGGSGTAYVQCVMIDGSGFAVGTTAPLTITLQ